MAPQTPTVKPPLASGGGLLVRLTWLRGLAVVSQAGAILAVHLGLGMPLPLLPMLAIVAALGLMNLGVWWRLRQPWPAHGTEAAVHLAVDVLALGAQLYFSGGYANPFVSLLLLPVILAAAALPATQAWLMAGFAAGVYTLLVFFHLPLPAPQGLDAFNLHLWGMWFNFVASAALVAVFVTRLAASLRRREGELAEAREKALRDEGLFALGMLAAGAAHELSTPLGTLALVAKELEAEYGDDPDLGPDLATLRSQTERCKALLTRITATAGVARSREGQTLALDEWLEETVEHWRLMRPEVAAVSRWHGPQPAPRVRPDPMLAQALVSLYNNAADASPESVAIEGEWGEGRLALRVLDRGPGLPSGIAVGEGFVSTKGEGRGLGLALSRAAVERLGGAIDLARRDGEGSEGGGSVVSVRLPLAPLEAA